MVDRRERTPLYESYGQAFAAFRLPVLQTQVPYRSRFSKEILDTSGAVGRSTLFPADRAFALPMPRSTRWPQKFCLLWNSVWSDAMTRQSTKRRCGRLSAVSRRTGLRAPHSGRSDDGR